MPLAMSPAATTEKNAREKLATSPSNLPMPGSAAQRKLNAVKTPTRSATPSDLHIPEQPVRMLHPRDVHPRYSIYAYGCSDTVYGVWQACLQISPGESCHSWRASSDGWDSLRAIRELKPFGSAGHECYGWIDEPILRKYQDGCDDDRLVIGLYEHDTIGETEQDVDIEW